MSAALQASPTGGRPLQWVYVTVYATGGRTGQEEAIQNPRIDPTCGNCRFSTLKDIFSDLSLPFCEERGCCVCVDDSACGSYEP
jgi:hypothetical protein